LSGLDVSAIDRAYTVMPPSFAMTFREHDDDRDCSVAFDAGFYDPVGVRRFVDRFVRWLDTAVQYPDLSLETVTELTGLPRRSGDFLAAHGLARGAYFAFCGLAAWLERASRARSVDSNDLVA